MYDWRIFTPTGEKAVDMCAAIIVEHRAKNLPIKAIHLLPVHYYGFKSWLQKQMKRDLLPEEKMEFDGVYIEPGDPRQASRFLIEMWATKEEVYDALTQHGKIVGKA